MHSLWVYNGWTLDNTGCACIVTYLQQFLTINCKCKEMYFMSFSPSDNADNNNDEEDYNNNNTNCNTNRYSNSSAKRCKCWSIRCPYICKRGIKTYCYVYILALIS